MQWSEKNIHLYNNNMTKPAPIVKRRCPHFRGSFVHHTCICTYTDLRDRGKLPLKYKLLAKGPTGKAFIHVWRDWRAYSWISHYQHHSPKIQFQYQQCLNIPYLVPRLDLNSVQKRNDTHVRANGYLLRIFPKSFLIFFRCRLQQSTVCSLAVNLHRVGTEGLRL